MIQYTENAISPTFRTTIKENNITVWTIESESGYTYNVTVFEGKVTSCKREGGTSCPGYFHRGTCHHATLVLEREKARHIKAAHAQFEAEKKQEYLPPLHGSQGFSLLK